MISCWRDFRLTYTARGKASADVRGSMTTLLWHLFLCGAMLGSKAVIRQIKHFYIMLSSARCGWVSQNISVVTEGFGSYFMKRASSAPWVPFKQHRAQIEWALRNISVMGNVTSWTKEVFSMHMAILLTALFSPREHRCETSHCCNMKMTLARWYWRSHL